MLLDPNNKIKFGINPIGWRNDDMPWLGKENNLRQLLSEVALSGFQGTEVGGFFPDAEELNYEINLRHLQIAGQWFSSYIVRDGINQTGKEFSEFCEYLQSLNAHIAVVCESTYNIYSLDDKNLYEEQPHLTENEWTELANGLNELGKIAAKYDIKLAYHHHLGTVVQTKDEVDKLMSMTDPDLVGLLYDTGHAYVSDGEYMDILKRHISRIKHVHFKDVRDTQLLESKNKGMTFRESVLNSVFTVPGDGNLNFKKVYDELVKNNYSGWIMIEAEQDPSKANPLEMAIKGSNYILNKLLK